MNKLTIGFISFIFGGVVGSLITKSIVEEKEHKKSDQRVEDVRSAYRKKIYNDIPEEVSAKDDVIVKKEGASVAKSIFSEKEMKEYYDYVAQYNKLDLSEDHNTSDIPEVIPPEEFDAYDDYKAISLIHYADGIVADEDGNIIDNITELVGTACNRFGEFESDAVHVRNDVMKTYFEILDDDREFVDVAIDHPYILEKVVDEDE